VAVVVLEIQAGRLETRLDRVGLAVVALALIFSPLAMRLILEPLTRAGAVVGQTWVTPVQVAQGLFI
jgi:hypothetical protein